MRPVPALLLALAATALPPLRAAPPTPEQLARIEAALPERAYATPQAPRRVLIFSRTSGFRHASIETGVAALRRVGEATGAYTADWTEDQAVFTAGNLARYDAIVFLSTTGNIFDLVEQRADLLAFVEGGKGIVGIHAATDTCYNWPVWGEMFGGYFDGHPWNAGSNVGLHIHEPDHPINAGFGGAPRHRITDEIYQLRPPYSRETHRVIVGLDIWETDFSSPGIAAGIRRTDGDFAISQLRRYGAGRVFYCSLGHNHHVFWTREILAHYLAGLQWALGDLEADATPRPFTPQPLPEPDEHHRAAATWDGATASTAWARIEDALPAASTEPLRLAQAEAGLLWILDNPAHTAAARRRAGEALRTVATVRSWPVLERLLADPATAPWAKPALEVIPGEGIDRELRRVLDTAPAGVRPLLIDVLAVRGDRRSVGALRRIAGDAASPDSGYALRALARLGTDDAWNALLALDRRRVPAVWEALADAAARGPAEGLAARWAALLALEPPEPFAGAAWLGAARLDPASAPARVEAALTDPTGRFTGAALVLVPELPAEAAGALAELLPRVPTGFQPALVEALARRGDAAAARAVLAVARANPPVEVLLACQQAFARLPGDAAVTRWLAASAGNDTDARKAARASLTALAGAEVQPTLVTLASSPGAPGRDEALRQLGWRGDDAAATFLLSLRADRDAATRGAALEALGSILPPARQQEIFAWFRDAPAGAERNAAVRAWVDIVQRDPVADTRAAVWTEALATATPDHVRASLPALVRVGGTSARAFLVRTLHGADDGLAADAARALARWPKPEVAPDLVAAAQARPGTPVARAAIDAALAILPRPEAWADEALRPVVTNLVDLVEEPADLLALARHLRGAEDDAGFALAGRLVAKPGFDPAVGEPLLGNLRFRRGAAEPLELERFAEPRGTWFAAGGAALRGDDPRRLDGAAGTGVLVNGPAGNTRDLHTVDGHGDIRLRVEFLVARGSNSGVYLQSRYEIQILDSHGRNKPGSSDCGGIYERWGPDGGYEGKPPRVNAARPAGEWQVYDIVFRAPRFGPDGAKTANARFEEVRLNGVLIHEDAEVTGPTRGGWDGAEVAIAPLRLQGDHGPVAYRNIRWEPLP